MGFARKIKRRQQKEFMKTFKKSMKNFRMQVKCSVCGIQPEKDQKIDDWHINKDSEGVDLICTDCYTDEEVVEDE